MSEMGFYSLPTGKIHKETKKSRLKIFQLVMLEVSIGT